LSLLLFTDSSVLLRQNISRLIFYLKQPLRICCYLSYQASNWYDLV